MKLTIPINLLFSVIMIFSINLSAQVSKIEINKNWKFRQVGKDEWYDAQVPGCVHTDLLSNKVIPDPFYRTNEKNLQWIDKNDWEYLTDIFIPGELIQKKFIELEFLGLDTYADVFLNENRILSADNMFRTWKVDCKDYLKQGNNTLRIVFHSPIRRDIPKLEKLGYNLPAVNDQSEIGELGDKRISVFARKAPYHYGWDWGPRFVTSGIWRPIILKAWNDVKINNIQIIQKSLSKDLAALSSVIDCFSDIDGLVDLKIKFKEHELVNKSVRLRKGNNKIYAAFEIVNPKFWWPNGLGDHFLYEFETVLSMNSKELDKMKNKFGVRTIQVVQEADSIGTSFYFKVNGIPVFMKGANYIPSDVFLNRVTKEDYSRIIQSAVDANMNMLRVWGGGIYENDVFYDLADENGILIWQDFMFACSMYPGDFIFLENVKQEVIDNVIRLRNHPSIAIWVGNNEIEDGWAYWGWKQSFNEKHQNEIYDAYKEIFFNIIPSVVKEYDGTRFYWPSSPSSDYGRSSRQEAGDLHYWGVWHGKEPFENFQTKIGRFMSEYGFQSFPELKTVKSYTIQDDWDIESEVMSAHQRSGIGNLRIRDYLKMYYKTPKDFHSFLYVGQVLQAYGIKQAIEAHRRAKPYCMGSLFWQIDDCWPVASWSSIDYFKRWKAQHYIAKKAYEPLIISPVMKDDKIIFTVINDFLDDLQLELNIDVLDFSGKVIYSKQFDMNIGQNSVKEIISLDKNELIRKSAEESTVVVAQLKTQDKIAAENFLYFRQPKDLRLEKPVINFSITEQSDGYLLNISSDKLAKDVYLSFEEDEVFFEDNYFDLLPMREKNIKIKSSKKIDNIKDKLRIVSLADSF